MTVRVVSASEAAELDRRSIAGGVPSRALMQAAGRGSAQLLLERYPLEAAHGVAVYAGGGNNGGDAWVVAGELARRGVRVRIAEVVPARTPDAIAEREAASAALEHAVPDGSEGLIVDGLLGTGASGAPRDEIAGAIGRIDFVRSRGRDGPRVVALDVPSGVDATTGATPGAHVCADLTVSFGSLKRGLLVNRGACGAIVVLDIGLSAEAARFGELSPLVDAAMALGAVPGIPAWAHKGTRRKLLVVGGSAGMAGAAVLAARAAMRSGIGMVKLCVAPESMTAVQAAEPVAMAAPWPTDAGALHRLAGWAHAMLIGPGIGDTPASRTLVEQLLGCWKGPVVLDADALNVFSGDAGALAGLLADRAAVITPHAVEFARLRGTTVEEVNERLFEIAAELARAVGATVLLKGVPTVVSDGLSTGVCASGTPVLATAGSGDVLSGIVATLLAQTGDARASACTAAWVHGRAAELAGMGRVRGVSLQQVMESLSDAWGEPTPCVPPVLAELPAVGERHAGSPIDGTGPSSR